MLWSPLLFGVRLNVDLSKAWGNNGVGLDSFLIMICFTIN